jgi:hypothetical protein
MEGAVVTGQKAAKSIARSALRHSVKTGTDH